MKKVFIDGKAGTTGLRIFDRLGERGDVEIMTLSEELRKDPDARRQMLNTCDIAFLCLPDAASREAVSMIENENVIVLDTSTAHRTDPCWTYGFPELSVEQEARVANAKRIAVPGCHASGFIALVYPLVKAGILSPDALLSCHSLTGYSGGGKNMIAAYEDSNRGEELEAPRQYGISQTHKHLPEMQAMTGLHNAPIFSPIVGDFYSGMEVSVPLFASQLQGGATVADIRRIYAEQYHGPFVTYCESLDKNGFLSANAMSGKDSMKITVLGNEERIVLCAAYDNLGKGASGAAIQCMNLALGIDKTTGLVL